MADWEEVEEVPYRTTRPSNKLTLDPGQVIRRPVKKGVSAAGTYVAAFKTQGNLKKVMEHMDITKENQELIMEQANAVS